MASYGSFTFGKLSGFGRYVTCTEAIWISDVGGTKTST
jgi:hypothetical protein